MRKRDDGTVTFPIYPEEVEVEVEKTIALQQTTNNKRQIKVMLAHTYLASLAWASHRRATKVCPNNLKDQAEAVAVMEHSVWAPAKRANSTLMNQTAEEAEEAVWAPAKRANSSLMDQTAEEAEEAEEVTAVVAWWA